MRIKTSERGFTLMEILVVIIIIGILASLSYSSYSDIVERHRSAEVYPVFALFKKGYDIAKSEGQSDLTVWNPNVEEVTNSNWNHFEMDNPNASTQAYFIYDAWDSGFSSGAAPVSASRNVIIAFRRNTRAAYTRDYDGDRYIYMDLDTGKVFKSRPY